jgi:hypothetical protein
MHCVSDREKIKIKKFSYESIENAFAKGDISLIAFAEVLSDNFGKKKARKILRKNLDISLKRMNLSWEQRQEHLQLISLLV